jgi:hypothetical protein
VLTALALPCSRRATRNDRKFAHAAEDRAALLRTREPAATSPVTPISATNAAAGVSDISSPPAYSSESPSATDRGRRATIRRRQDAETRTRGEQAAQRSAGRRPWVSPLGWVALAEELEPSPGSSSSPARIGRSRRALDRFRGIAARWVERPVEGRWSRGQNGSSMISSSVLVRAGARSAPLRSVLLFSRFSPSALCNDKVRAPLRARSSPW